MINVLVFSVSFSFDRASVMLVFNKNLIYMIEYSSKFRTSFSKLKIMRTAFPNSTKKCDVLVDQCLTYKNCFPGDWHECMGSLISIGPLKEKRPNFYLSTDFYSTLYQVSTMTVYNSIKFWRSRLFHQKVYGHIRYINFNTRLK